MPYYIDNLDDVLAIAGSSSFEGGQVSGITPNLIANNQASEMLNITISPSGDAESRLGIESMSNNVSGGSTIQGMHYFDTPTVEELVVATNGSLFRSTSATSFATTGGTIIDQTADVAFSQLLNRVYYSDGTSNLHFTDGTNSYRQGSSILLITITNEGNGYSTSTVTIGTPQQTYGTTATATVSSYSGGKITGISVTTAGAGYTSAPSVTITGNGTGAAATATLNNLAPAGFRLIKAFTNRMFAVGSGVNRNTLYASDILDTEVWKATNSIIVGGNDGEDITSIQPFYDYEILVFKPNKIYLVAADPTQTTAAGWTVRLLNDRTGCIAGKTVSFVNKDIFFLAKDGIRSVSRSIADDFYIVGTPLSEPIKDIINRINWSYVGKANASFYNNRYFLAVPLDASTTPSHLIVYNSLFNSFEGLWNIQASFMTITNFSSQSAYGFSTYAPKLAIGSPTSQVGHSFAYKSESTADSNTDYQDYGSSYTSRLVTKAYDFDDRLAQKYGSHYEIEFHNSGATNVTLSMRRDTDGNDVTLATAVDTISPGGLTLPFTLPATLSSNTVKRRADSLRSYQKWRNMRVKIESPARKLAIRSVLMAANPDTIEVQKNI